MAKSKVDEKAKLENEKELCSKRLINAGKLIKLTKDEAERWKVTVAELSSQIEALFGDVFIAVGAISYNGPFTGVYRAELVDKWRAELREKGVPCSEGASIVRTLGDPMVLREWMMDGLPSDAVS